MANHRPPRRDDSCQQGVSINRLHRADRRVDQGPDRRPAAVVEARKALDEGKLDAAALRAVEDEAVRAAVKMQEGVGLDVVSDGEMRRLNFQDSFGAAVEGFDASASTVNGNR